MDPLHPKSSLDHPNPLFTSSFALADWISKQDFPFNQMEKDLLFEIKDKAFTCEPSSVHDIQDLRILFWQVVGANRLKSRT